jgi:hypothetical protein
MMPPHFGWPLLVGVRPHARCGRVRCVACLVVLQGGTLWNELFAAISAWISYAISGTFNLCGSCAWTSKCCVLCSLHPSIASIIRSFSRGIAPCGAIHCRGHLASRHSMPSCHQLRMPAWGTGASHIEAPRQMYMLLFSLAPSIHPFTHSRGDVSLQATWKT